MYSHYGTQARRNLEQVGAIVFNIGQVTSFEIQQLQIVLDEHFAHMFVKMLVVVKVELYQCHQFTAQNADH